jgi:hypothetical protein
LSWASCTQVDFAQPGALPNPVGYSNISWPPAELNQAMETLSALGYQGMQLLGWVQEAYLELIVLVALIGLDHRVAKASILGSDQEVFRNFFPFQFALVCPQQSRG